MPSLKRELVKEQFLDVFISFFERIVKCDYIRIECKRTTHFNLILIKILKN